MKSTLKAVFHTYTGYGKRPEGSPEAGDALAAVFLPLAALACGAAAALMVWLTRLCGLNAASVAAGLAVIAALGGWRKFRAVSSLFAAEAQSLASAVVATLALVFMALAIYEVSAYRDTASIYAVMLYLPAAGAVSMLSAAAVMKQDECPGTLFAHVKGGHMLLGCALAFVLMLPGYGFKSLAIIAASVLAGPVTALALGKRGRGETPYVAGMAGELLFVILLALFRGPAVYY